MVRGGALVVVLAVWCARCRRSWGALFGGDFGDGGAGGGFVDDCFVGGVGRDEGLQGEVVDGAWESSAGLVDEVGGGVAEELVAAADEFGRPRTASRARGRERADSSRRRNFGVVIPV